MKKLTLKSPAFQKGEVLTRAQLKKVIGGSGSSHGEPCETHADCTAHAPICVISGTILGSVCCDSASLQPGGFCDFNHIGS